MRAAAVCWVVAGEAALSGPPSASGGIAAVAAAVAAVVAASRPSNLRNNRALLPFPKVVTSNLKERGTLQTLTR